MAAIKKPAKRFKCVECGEVYVSPIPIWEAQHKCKKTMPPKTTRKGMLPDEQ